MERLFVIGYVLSFIVLLTHSSVAQEVSPAQLDTAETHHPLRIQFARDTLVLIANSYSFNSLSISNTSDSLQHFRVAIQVPGGWKLLVDIKPVYTLQPHENLVIPLRLMADLRSPAAQTYQIVCNVTTIAPSSQENRSVFSALVTPASKWSVYLTNPDITLEPGVKQSDIGVMVSNQGNIAEQLRFDYLVDAPLRLGSQSVNSILLPPGKDTIINVPLSVPEITDRPHPAQTVVIIVKDGRNTVKSVYQKISRFISTYRQQPSQWYGIPAYIEWVLQSGNNTNFFYVRTAGQLQLSDRRKMDYSFRSKNYTFGTGSFNASSNELVTVNYEDNKYNLSVGDQYSTYDGVVDGVGVLVGYHRNNFRSEVLGLKRRNQNLFFYGTKNTVYLNNGHNLSNQLLLSIDDDNRSTAYYTITRYEMPFSASKKMVFTGGVGQQIYKDSLDQRTFSGGGGGVLYESYNKKIDFRTEATGFSAYFPGISRGLTISNSEFRYKIKSSFLGALYHLNSNQPVYYSKGKFVSLFNVNEQELGTKWGHIFNQRNAVYNSLSITLQPSLILRSQDSGINALQTTIHKLNLSFDAYGKNDVRFSLGGNIGSVRIARPDSTGTTSFFNVFATTRFRKINTQLRYEKGPFYYPEIPDYFRKKNYPTRIDFNTSVQHFLFENKLSMINMMQYFYQSVSNFRGLVFRNDLDLNLYEKGWAIHFTTTYDFLRKDYPLYFFSSIRKNLAIPVLGVRKYYDLKVLLYKDKNNNNIKDEDEEVIPNVLVAVNNNFLATNSKGEVLLRNISPGIYSIDLTAVNSIVGWIPDKSLRDTVIINRRDVVDYVAYKPSKFIKGRLELVKSRFGDNLFRPSGIRVTIVASDGRVYYTFTQSDGGFYMNLPPDVYTVSINRNIFGDLYTLRQGDFTVDLRNENEKEVVFTVIERGRDIRIRKE